MKSPAVKELDKQIKDAKSVLENLEAARELLAGPRKERKKRTPKAEKAQYVPRLMLTKKKKAVVNPLENRDEFKPT